MKLLFLLLTLALAATLIQAAPKYYKGQNSMTVVSNNITVQVIGGGLPRLIISSNLDNNTQYDLSFDSMYQVSNLSQPSKNKVGSKFSLSSYNWILGSPATSGDTVTFTMAGMKDQTQPYVTFTVHVNSTGMSYKFDVDIANFQYNMWQTNAVGVATCYTTKVKTDGNKNEQNVTVQATDKKNQYSFGATLSIVPTANLVNSTQTVSAQLQPGDGSNVACIVYGSFDGISTELIHDPTVGMSGASSVQVSFMVLAISFLLYFLF